MISIPGYRRLGLIYESQNSLVYRALREQDDSPVILKSLKHDPPPRREVEKYEQEYDLVAELADRPGIVRILGMERVGDAPVLVVEDFGGESLKHLLKTRRFPVKECLRIGIRVASCLGEVHAARIIHKDVNPANLIYNQTTGEVRLIDFGISTRLARESVGFESPEVMEGTLAYISPEQTGRMNRPLDFRTDHYSLGATLYHLLTGALPFDVDDPMKLIRCHLAETPVSPHLRCPEIPGTLAKLVMKLLAKDPEQRYQSAVGIRIDLEECLRQLEETRTVAPFPLGQWDVSEKLLVPQKLYGREPELVALVAGFDRVRQGGKELMLVSGLSGIGKTALVKELYRPLTQQGGFFISGKFDPLLRSRPYSAVAQAFKQLCRQLLCEESASVARWREKLVDALGSQSQVILEPLPELRHLLPGTHPAVAELPPTESEHRLHRLLERLVGVFARPEHPLVLFLDDLQWADSASLKLLQVLLTSPSIESLYLIGGYRVEEVSPTHPLSVTLAELGQGRSRIGQVNLAGLGIEPINQLVADTVRSSAEATRVLAELLALKSDGNPFLLIELLEALFCEGLLRIDPRAGQWTWDVERIRSHDVTDRAAELMATKIQRLDPDTQAVLRVCACLGERFELGLLSRVIGRPQAEILEALLPAVAQGVLLPLSDAVATLGADPSSRVLRRSLEFKFSHDRLHQAVDALTPEAEKRAVHLRIGRLLCSEPLADDDAARIFDRVLHLNAATSLITDPKERIDLARLNLLAGKRAKSSAAFHQALSYLVQGRSLLGAEGWNEHLELALSLHEEAAEAACACGQFDEMEALATAVVAHARSVLETVNVEEVRIIAAVMRNNPLAAVDLGFSMLRRLGVRMPRKPGRLTVVRLLLRIAWETRNRTTEDLLDLPEMTDPYHVAAMRILARLIACTFFCAPALLLTVVCKMTLQSVRYGTSPASGPAYAAYATIVCDGLGNISRGYPYGELASRLIARQGDHRYKCETLLFIHAFVKHWRAPLKDTLPGLLEAYQCGLESGDCEMAAYSATMYCNHIYVHGFDLEHVTTEFARYVKSLSGLNNEIAMGVLNLSWQVALNLRGNSPKPWVLRGELIDESILFPVCEAKHNKTLMASILFSAGMLCLHFDKYEEGLRRFDRLMKIFDAYIGTFAGTRIIFFNVLIRLGAWESFTRLQRVRQWSKMLPSLLRIRRYARYAPMNHLHLVHLVQAERLRVRGKHLKAEAHYALAAKLAGENGFVNDLALVCERAGAFYLKRQKRIPALSYLRKAHEAYRRWGAQAKVRDLETRYPQLLSQSDGDEARGGQP